MTEQELTTRQSNAADDSMNRWVDWCRTRRFFAPQVKQNVLARLQPPSALSAGEPDAFLESDMPYLNMAIHALCEQGGHEDEAECFLGIYWFRTNIKALAAERQCARGTIYNRARRFAIRAQSLSRSIRRVHEQHMGENCSKIVEQNSSSVD